MTDDTRIDFGDERDDVPAMTDAQFEEWIARIAATLNAPTATPRLEMWKQIQDATGKSRPAQPDGIPGVTPLRRHWRLLSAIAAAIVIGVVLDRLALRQNIAERVAASGPATSPAAHLDSSAVPSRLYRMAAAQTLTQAEALLVAYRASDAQRPDVASLRQLGTWGRDVLTSTRLLLDSPAARDPQLRALLDDLELVLVQIVRLSGTPLDSTNRSLIDEALRNRKLLPRIQTAVPAPVAAAASTE